MRVRFAIPGLILGGVVAVAACSSPAPAGGSTTSTASKGCGAGEANCVKGQECEVASQTCVAGPKDGDPCSSDGETHCGSLDASGSTPGLVCQGGKLVAFTKCSPAQKCMRYANYTTIGCGPMGTGPQYALLGSPCGLEGSAACSANLSAILDCKQGYWVVGHQCSSGEGGNPGAGGSSCALDADGNLHCG